MSNEKLAPEIYYTLLYFTISGVGIIKYTSFHKVALFKGQCREMNSGHQNRIYRTVN
jgi:hypothetical protein